MKVFPAVASCCQCLVFNLSTTPGEVPCVHFRDRRLRQRNVKQLTDELMIVKRMFYEGTAKNTARKPKKQTIYFHGNAWDPQLQVPTCPGPAAFSACSTGHALSSGPAQGGTFWNCSSAHRHLASALSSTLSPQFTDYKNPTDAEFLKSWATLASSESIHSANNREPTYQASSGNSTIAT